jgi:NACalpha-BTF3-like transcription factor
VYYVPLVYNVDMFRAMGLKHNLKHGVFMTKELSTFTINIAKTNQKLDIVFAELPEASQRYIICYGLKQCLNDAHSAFKDVAEAAGQVEAKLAALQNGTVTLRATSERVDPIIKAVNDRLIELVVKQSNVKRKALLEALKAKNISIRDFILGKDGGETLIAKFTKEEEAARKKAATIGAGFELDLSSLSI